MSTQKAGWLPFVELCAKAHDVKQLDALLQLFLTQEEQTHVATRVLIVHALLQDQHTQRDIAQDLSVSITKITRASNNLKSMDASLKAYIKSDLEKVI